MGERFEMSFRNIEFRAWCYIMLPCTIAALLVVWYTDYRYQYFGPVIVLLGWVIYYSWRYIHRKKRKEERSRS